MGGDKGGLNQEKWIDRGRKVVLDRHYELWVQDGTLAGAEATRRAYAEGRICRGPESAVSMRPRMHR